MKKKNIIKYAVLAAAFIITAIIGLLISDPSMAFMSLAAVVALILGFCDSLSGDYAKEVLPIHNQLIELYKEQIDNYEELINNYESRIKTYDELYHSQRLLNLKQYNSLMFVTRALKEFTHSEHDMAFKYAHRWLDKRDEVLKMINDTPDIETSREKLEEVSDAVIKLHNEILRGSVDIER